MNIAEMELCECKNNVQQELQELAYFKWLNAGKPEGRDIEFWCDAEREMFGMTADEHWLEIDSYFRETANLSGEAYLRYHGVD